MKVLYIGCYRDGTGWGQAATDYILSLDSIGVQVVPRPVKLNSNLIELHPRIAQLENRDSSGCDICIQHVLPHMMDHNPRFKKNIALYATETSNFKRSGWSRRINFMDEAWVINNQMVEASRNSGVEIPIKVVPHATNFGKFDTNYNKIEFLDNDTFKFYFIGELNERKNLRAFLKAFHSEFRKSDNVSIVIKTSKHGVSPEQCASEVRDICNEVKVGLKLYPNLNDYKEDLIITDRLSEVDMMRLHASCDCFVMPSYGEAWSIPCFDAMGFGKTPICTNIGGMSDFIGNAGFLIEGRQEPVYGMLNTFPYLFTAEEEWCSIDISELKKVMRHVYENRESLEEMRNLGAKNAYDYSYPKIGALMKKLIEESNDD